MGYRSKGYRNCRTRHLIGLFIGGIVRLLSTVGNQGIRSVDGRSQQQESGSNDHGGDWGIGRQIAGFSVKEGTPFSFTLEECLEKEFFQRVTSAVPKHIRSLTKLPVDTWPVVFWTRRCNKNNIGQCWWVRLVLWALPKPTAESGSSGGATKSGWGYLT